MSWLRSIERLAESVVEGSAQRLFQPRLQPVQLAKAAARVLAASQVIGPSGPEVANSYAISLHPADFARFASYQQALATEVQRYLQAYARDHGLRVVAPWRVQLVADTRVRPGTVRVDAQFLDTAPPPAAGQDEALEQTRRLPAVQPSPAPARATAWLELESGARLALDAPRVTIGRALDNAVPIPDERVSRHHAVIERAGPEYVLRDLDSTNGTTVGGQPIVEHRLRDGDEIAFGGVLARFRQVPTD